MRIMQGLWYRIGGAMALAATLWGMPAAAADPPPQGEVSGEHALGEVTITATKTPHDVSQVPGRVDIITKEEIQRLAVQKVDDVLQQVAGINVIRGNGIFSFTTTATLRGLSSDQARTLVMVDGIPLNKADTGDVNFNRINPNDIERIEVLRGPASSLYGNNAMGGVINIITKKPARVLEGAVSGTAGNLGTFGGDLAVSGRLKPQEHGFFYRLSGHYLDSSGYVSTPPAQRNAFTVNRFLEEGNAGLVLGYDFAPRNSVAFRLDYYDDIRGEGTKIRAPNGLNREFQTWAPSLQYTGESGEWRWQAKTFYNRENYGRVSETARGITYTRFDVDAARTDLGADAHVTLPPVWGQRFTVGGDVRDGRVNGTDVYKTSPDWTNNRGELLLTGGWIEDEMALFSDRLHVAGGVRFDYARFFDGGYFSTLAPFNATNGLFSAHDWTAWSPHASARYAFIPEWSAYASYSRGFRASILNDLTRSGIMYGRQTIANPNLNPETLDTVEVGTDYRPWQNVQLSASLYGSQGHDFLYYVPTGGVLNGAPLYQRQNVSKVLTYGMELGLKYTPVRDLILGVNYTYAFSKIEDFPLQRQNEGQQLTNVPHHQIKGTVTWLNPYVNISIMPRYKSQQLVYTNQVTATTGPLGGYFDLDAKIWREVWKGVIVSVSGQNLTNKRYTESTTDMSPGLLVFGQIEYRFAL